MHRPTWGAFSIHQCVQKTCISADAECSLEDVWADWHEGILMSKATRSSEAVRREPLQQLEQRTLGQGISWRQGGAMRKEISRRKTLVYALMRRINACSRSLSPAAKLSIAVQALLDLCQQIGDEMTAKQPLRKRKDGSVAPCSFLQLVSHLGQNEISCNAYEVEVFGWEPLKTMPGGNPRKTKEQ